MASHIIGKLTTAGDFERTQLNATFAQVLVMRTSTSDPGLWVQSKHQGTDHYWTSCGITLWLATERDHRIGLNTNPMRMPRPGGQLWWRCRRSSLSLVARRLYTRGPSGANSSWQPEKSRKGRRVAHCT
jgi:hypothetical protein